MFQDAPNCFCFGTASLCAVQRNLIARDKEELRPAELERLPVQLVEISCREVWREISNYIDGDLPPDFRARMAAHLAKCSDCTALYDGIRNVVHLLNDGSLFELPLGFSARLRRRIMIE
jgi:anti-sigma factor RsiW